MNIAILGFLDVSAMTATYVTRHRQKPPGELVLRRNLAVLDAETEFEDTPLLKEWKTARAILTRIKNAAAGFLKGEPAKLGLAFIDVLRPGAHAGWASDDGDYSRAYHRLRVCMIPSPGAWTYSGGEAMVIPVGQLTAVNQMALCSEVNFGTCSRVHLVCDIKRAEVV